MKEVHRNGNAKITILDDKSRVVQFENKLELEYPLNIFIDGIDLYLKGSRDYIDQFLTLKNKVRDLPKGTEINLSISLINKNLIGFIYWLNLKGFICNLTISQSYVESISDKLIEFMEEKVIRDLHIVPNDINTINDLPETLIYYRSTFIDLYIGKNSYKELELLDVSNIKCFGYSNEIDVDKVSLGRWINNSEELLRRGNIEFDDLAIDQLNLESHFDRVSWSYLTRVKDSVYIDISDKSYSSSKFDKDKIPWVDKSIQDYYLSILD